MPGYGGADACEKECSCHHNDDHSSDCVGTCTSSRRNQPLKQGVHLDGPQTPWKEPKPTPTPTPESAVASTAGVGVAKKKKHGRPKKTTKAPKSTEVMPQKSDTSMVNGRKEPSKPEQTTPITTTAVSADATVVQDECPDVNESSSHIRPSDMKISKVGQASAAEVEIAALAAAAAAAAAVAVVASHTAASAFARQQRQKNTSNAWLQIGMQISTPTQRRKPTAKPSQRQAISPSFLRKPHWLT